MDNNVNIFVELNKFNDFRFFDKDHSYYHFDKDKNAWDKIKTSTTGFCKKFEPEFDKINIATRVAQRDGKTVVEVLAAWEQEGKIACAKGTAIHSYLEMLFANKNMDTKENENADKGYKTQAEKFFDMTKNKLIPIKSEVVVGDLAYDLCGMIDQLFWNVRDNELQLYDWKTNKTINTQNNFGEKMLLELSHLDKCELNLYSLQLAMYKNMLERNTNLKIGKRFLVHFTAEDFKILPCLDLGAEIELISDRILQGNVKK